MLRIAKESHKVKGHVISVSSNGYSLVRYHEDYGVYSQDTVLDGVECSLYPWEDGYKKAIEEAVRKKAIELGVELPKLIYIEESIIQDEFEDDYFPTTHENYSDDDYGKNEFSDDMKDYLEYLRDNEDQ